jgi:hypothetical protein
MRNRLRRFLQWPGHKRVASASVGGGGERRMEFACFSVPG